MGQMNIILLAVVFSISEYMVMRAGNAQSELSAPVPANDSLECRVGMIGGVPTFIVNGKPHSGMCYSSYDCNLTNLNRRVRQFMEAGCDIFNFVVEISGYGYSHPMWIKADRWDFSDLDSRARTILAAAPNAMLLPRLYIDAPQWWRKENPNEMMLLDNGSRSFGERLFALPRLGDYPSLASKKWRVDMKYAIETVINHIEHSDYGNRVLGYQLSGQKTEEWYHWSMNTEQLGDYSYHTQRAFRDWLRVKYGNDENLRKAWHQPSVKIKSAQIPNHSERYGDRSKTFRDPIVERPVIDFHTFWSEIMADTIAYFAKVVKDKTRGKKVVGAFYGYTFEFTDLAEDAGHLALWKLIRCPHIDFIMAPSSYFNRNLPGAPYFRAPVASLNLHGKMFWNDFDQVSYKYYDKLKANPKLKQWEYQMGLTKTPEEFVWMNRREIGMALAQGAQVCHFDIHGGYYEDPVIMAGVKRLAEIRKDSLDVDDRSSKAEILLIVDEESEHYLTFRNSITRTLLSDQIAVMPFVAPYDAVLLSDLDTLDTRGYKLILVLNALKLDAGQRNLLKRKLARDGKTVVWFYAPGYFNDSKFGTMNMKQITGINIIRDTKHTQAATARLNYHASYISGDLKLVRGDQFCVEDLDAIPLATRSDDHTIVVVAKKQFADWLSIYTAAAPLTAPVLKQIAIDAGVHIYDRNPHHIIFANRHYLTLGVGLDGGRTLIHLPRATTVIDLSTGANVCENADNFVVEMRPKEVRIFFMK